MVARAVAAAVERAILTDEIEQTKKGRELVADSLYRFAMDLRQQGNVDVSDLLEVVIALREGRVV